MSEDGRYVIPDGFRESARVGPDSARGGRSGDRTTHDRAGVLGRDEVRNDFARGEAGGLRDAWRRGQGSRP
ncbi:hypothetical protein [Streptomyces hainanensis]|uniref:Uncharacterized protein n=1 Tax=Streptomyces hainanensis TaxID=402648 RepID=A0A4R4T732_9ACTN|nr:hypothetical protein [Streptomyces hainanensis]TDC72958.1 hypothetical protein E1283_20375 [Streptomyces hainanensis]